jgi:hypothetical protein
VVDSLLCLLVSNYMQISYNFHNSKSHKSRTFLWILVSTPLPFIKALHFNPVCTRQETDNIYDDKHHDLCSQIATVVKRGKRLTECVDIDGSIISQF